MDLASKIAATLMDSRGRRIASAAGAFAVAALAKHALVSLMLHLQVQRAYLRLQDAILTGALAAIIVSVMLSALAARRRQVLQSIQVVADLNHELRNALQVILGSEFLPKTDKAEAILESVERIERNLANLLGGPVRPGRRWDIDRKP